MARDVHLRGVRRKSLDEDKLAMAFLMLAKIVADKEGDSDKEGVTA
jgi:hypothetical protein